MNAKNIGIAGTVISGILLIFSIYKYNYCMSLFGASRYITTSWKDRAGNYKIMIIVCAVVLLVSVILLVSSLLKDKGNKTVQVSNSTQDKLQELEKIYNSGLINKEEYDAKRKDIIDKM